MKEADDSAAAASLATHAEWVQRMARALIGDDPEAADDLAQDALEVAVRRPPAEDRGLRGWLATVLRNRRTDVARADRRRRAREAAVAWLAPDAAPSAEEIAERLEVGQHIARAVAALPVRDRQIVYLRYFEQQSSPQIALRLGSTESTVRWRLKVSLDQIRTRLDEQEGGRKRWMAVLAPLLSPPAAPDGPPRTGVLLAAAGATVAAALLLLFGLRAGEDSAASSRPVEPVLPPRRPPAIAAAAITSGADACADLAPLRAELALREGEVLTHGRFADAFALGAPNPVARGNFGGVVDQAAAANPRCAHTVECRGLICRVETLFPAGDPPETACRARFGDRRLASRGQMSGGLTTVFDPVSGKPYSRRVDFYRLASQTGEPVEFLAQRDPGPLAPGRHRPLPPLPPTSSSCRPEAERLQAAIRRAWALLDRAVLASPEDRFASADRDPALEREVLAEGARLGAWPAARPGLDVECRGPRCALRPHAPGDPPWLRPVSRALGRGFFAGLMPLETGAPAGSRAFLALVHRAEERARAAPMRALCAFAEQAAEAQVLGRCQQRHHPRGQMLLVIGLPDPLETSPAERLTIDARGALAATPFGRCLVDELRALAQSFEIPPLREVSTQLYRLTLPGVTSILGDEARGCTPPTR